MALACSCELQTGSIRGHPGERFIQVHGAAASHQKDVLDALIGDKFGPRSQTALAFFSVSRWLKIAAGSAWMPRIYARLGASAIWEVTRITMRLALHVYPPLSSTWMMHPSFA